MITEQLLVVLAACRVENPAWGSHKRSAASDGCGDLSARFSARPDRRGHVPVGHWVVQNRQGSWPLTRTGAYRADGFVGRQAHQALLEVAGTAWESRGWRSRWWA